MTRGRGLLLALTLVAATPLVAACQTLGDRDWDDQRRPGYPREDQRYDPRDDRDGWNRAVPRYDPALRTGQDDGYEAGLEDGRRGHRFDPVGEKRYRSGDHGYDRRYGPKDLYKNNYRDGFRRGYQQGYEEARRYNRGGRSWWPFGR